MSLPWFNKNKNREPAVLPAAPPPALCTHCGKKPRNTGFDFCSAECGRAAGKARRPGPNPLGHARSHESSSSSAPLCEECGVRPKNVDKTQTTGPTVYYKFCGRRCREANAKRVAAGCLIEECGAPCETDYCTARHSKLAVSRGEADACLFCKEMAMIRPYKYCSKECSVKDKKKQDARRGDSAPTAVPRPAYPMPISPPPRHANTGSPALAPVPLPALPPAPSALSPNGRTGTTGSPEAIRSRKKSKAVDAGTCDYCRLKPKYVRAFDHCSKECATEARLSRDPYASSVESFDKITNEGDEKSLASAFPHSPGKKSGFSKTYSCCGSTLTMPNEPPPPFCPLCSFRAHQRELMDREVAINLAVEEGQDIDGMPQEFRGRTRPAPAPAPTPAPPPAPIDEPMTRTRSPSFSGGSSNDDPWRHGSRRDSIPRARMDEDEDEDDDAYRPPGRTAQSPPAYSSFSDDFA